MAWQEHPRSPKVVYAKATLCYGRAGCGGAPREAGYRGVQVPSRAHDMPLLRYQSSEQRFMPNILCCRRIVSYMSSDTTDGPEFANARSRAPVQASVLKNLLWAETRAVTSGDVAGLLIVLIDRGYSCWSDGFDARTCCDEESFRSNMLTATKCGSSQLASCSC